MTAEERVRPAVLASSLFDSDEERAYLDATMAAYDRGHKKLRDLLRPTDFLPLYREQVLGAGNRVPSLASGELRPVFGRAGQSILRYRFDRTDRRTSKLDLRSVVQAMYGSFGGADSHEIKSLMLFAHSVLVLDPLARRPQLEKDAISELNHDFLSNWGHMPWLKDIMIPAASGWSLEERLNDFADILCGLARIAPLIRDGTVTIVVPPDPHSLYFGDELDLRQRIASELFLVGAVPSPFNQDGRVIAQVLIQRAKEQLLSLLAFGDMSSIFAAGELDLIGIRALINEMIESGSIPPPLVHRTTEDRRLTSLAELDLPGVDKIRPPDMVTVRREEVFEHFRADVRTGLRAAAEEDDLEDARRGFSDEMRGAVQRLQRGVSKSRVIDDAVGGDAVAWLIGALAGWSIDGWRGATLGLGGKAGYEVVRHRPSPGQHALRSHYVALS